MLHNTDENMRGDFSPNGCRMAGALNSDLRGCRPKCIYIADLALEGQVNTSACRIWKAKFSQHDNIDSLKVQTTKQHQIYTK